MRGFVAKFVAEACAYFGIPRSQRRPQDSPTFCALPWVHSYCFPDGRVSLCCISADPVVNKKGAAYNLQTTSLKDIWHSQAMRNVRQKLIDGEKLSACSVCYDRELHGQSHRQLYNDIWLSRKDIDVSGAIARAGADPAFPKPLSVDYRFGNLCNLKCQICNSANSSQIEKEGLIPEWNPSSYVRLKHRGDGAEWYDSQEIQDDVIDFCSDVLHITLGGGEPSINKTTIEWLDKLIESGQSKKITIYASTNFTNVNPRFFDLFAQFGSPTLNLSIDGFGPLNDYLRYPSKWAVIERNAECVDKIRSRTNLAVNITPVVNVYNALAITDLFEWASQRGWGIRANQVRGVPQIDCALIPPVTRQRSIDRMQAFIDRTPGLGHHCAGSIRAMCSYLAEPVDEAAARVEVRRFAEFTGLLDAKRGLSFAKTDPEMAAALTEYYGVMVS